MSQPIPTSSGIAFRPGDFATLPEALDYAARGATGITVHGGRGEPVETLTFAELAADARTLARKFAHLGLRRGDRVALVADTSGDFVRCFFACQYAGLVPAAMPLPAAFGGRSPYVGHIRRMIRAADAAAALAPRTLLSWLKEATDGLDLIFVGTPDDLAACPQAAGDLPASAGTDLAYLQFSSGSTRFPTGVAVTHDALMSNVRAIIADGLAVKSGDRCVSWLPFYHDMGLVGFLLTPIAAQLPLDLLPTSDFARRPLLWPSLISRYSATLSFSPSFGYDLCARRAESAPPDGLDLSTWRVAGIGGDMIRASVLDRFAAAFQAYGFRRSAFVPSYGMAEATLAVSFAPLGRGIAVDQLDVDRLQRDGTAEIATPGARRTRDFARCGRVLPGHRIAVRGADGEILPERAVGRIFFAGPSLMREYFRDPVMTASAIGEDGWLDTGDLGYMVDGEIVITGRAKDLILVNGRNIAPQDLEWTVEHEVEGLRDGDVAAFSVDEAEVEAVVLLVQCRTGDPTRRSDLRSEVEGCLRKLHGIECQVILVPHNSLPYTSSGKLSRNRARQLYLEGAFGTQEAVGAA